MALTVGELTAFLVIDDRAVDPALRRAERALQSTGRTMGSDAERAGQQAGQNLGEGFVRGADGQWRDMRGDLVDAVRAAGLEAESEARQAGQQTGRALGDSLTPAARRAGDDAGDALGQGLADSGGDGADEAVSAWTERISKLKLGVAAIGTAAGAYLMDTFKTAMEQRKTTIQLGAALQATPAQAQRYGQAAGVLYKNAVVDNFEEGADAIKAIMGAGIAPPGATVAQLAKIGTKAQDLASTYDEELGGVTKAVAQLMATGLAKNSDQAFDIITKGFSTSANRGDDFLDTLNEYSVQWKRIGLDGKTAVGIIDQAVKKGARDSDQVADALGQFGEKALSGAQPVKDAFKSIGLNADTIRKKLQQGGKSGVEALQMTTDALRGTTDKQTRLNAATALFGDPGTVMGDALLAIDPASAAASSGMDKAAGSTDNLGKSLRDNAQTKLEQFKRGIEQGLVQALGTGIDYLDKFRGKVGGIWDDAGKGNEGAVDHVLAFFPLLYQRLIAKGKELVPKLGGMLSDAFQGVAEWIMANPEQALKLSLIAAGIIAGILTLPVLVAASVVAAGVTITYSFTRGLVDGFNKNITSLGTTAGGWFGGLWSRYIAGPAGRTWNSFEGGVRKLPGRASAALSGLGGSLSGAASRGWSSFQSASSRKASQFIGWVHGLPGRISAGVGSLGSLLTGKGHNVVQGLWNGISSMGGWLKSKLYGWARSSIPEPIAKALGINSPSKVTTAQGRWIARGLVDGMTGSTKQIKAASGKLSDIIADGLKPGKKRSKALATLGAGTKKLLALASQEERVAARLKTAQKSLADQIAARDKLAASVKQGVIDAADITKQDSGGWPQTADTILAGLKADNMAAQRFAANIATLRKKGVRADLISQIAQAGVEQGSSAAAALANANSSQVKQINSQQAALVKAATAAGTSAGNAMYGAGIQAAQGLVRGLQKEQKSIEAQMLKIAKAMSKSIRQALGIKSPSRVMALVGAYTAQGLVEGLEGERSAVNSTMASLVDTPMYSAGAYGRGGYSGGRPQKTIIEFRSQGRGVDEFILGAMRRTIRKYGGKDPDAVLIASRRG
ncbi:phage tail tape measure protein [Streptomyces sp. NPDC048663]|uniref:phage tail tape measure protein n=1 Tax=Streptomyces sp. NPDC048663 TaxID=3155638 RepID=UPI003441661B